MSAADVSALIERAAAELQRADLTSGEARQLQSETGQAAHQLAERVTAIAPRDAVRGPGRERARILATGTDADLQALDAEHARLAAQAERLVALRDRAHLVRQAAAAREASEGLPAQLDALGEALDRLGAARKAVSAGEQVVQELRAMVATSRGVARAAGLPAAAASPELAQRLVELLPAAAKHPREAFEQLGVTLAAPSRSDAGDGANGARWAA